MWQTIDKRGQEFEFERTKRKGAKRIGEKSRRRKNSRIAGIERLVTCWGEMIKGGTGAYLDKECCG